MYNVFINTHAHPPRLPTPPGTSAETLEIIQPQKREREKVGVEEGEESQGTGSGLDFIAPLRSAGSVAGGMLIILVLLRRY